MEQFDNWYRRHPRMNFIGHGKSAWRAAKERDRKIWMAALEWVILIHDESYDNPEKGIYVGDIIRDKLEKELKQWA